MEGVKCDFDRAGGFRDEVVCVTGEQMNLLRLVGLKRADKPNH